MLLKEPDMLCEHVCFCVVCMQVTGVKMHSLFCGVGVFMTQTERNLLTVSLRAGVLHKLLMLL